VGGHTGIHERMPSFSGALDPGQPGINVEGTTSGLSPKTLPAMPSSLTTRAGRAALLESDFGNGSPATGHK